MDCAHVSKRSCSVSERLMPDITSRRDQPMCGGVPLSRYIFAICRRTLDIRGTGIHSVGNCQKPWTYCRIRSDDQDEIYLLLIFLQQF